jgi:hypothetical protein
VRIVTRLVATCAAVALVLACVLCDPQGSLCGDDGDDAPASVDLSAVLPVTHDEPLVVPPISGLVFVDHQPPPSRLTTAEIFRPPRACG